MRRTILRRIPALLVSGMMLISVAGGTLRADDGDPQTPRTVTLAALPASAPTFALQYRLMPTVAERKPGNAAVFYYRAILLRSQVPQEVEKTYVDNYDRWTQWPADEKSLQEMRDWLKHYTGALEELKVAVYREHCDWEYRLQDLDGPDIIAFRLSEMQECRALARVLSIKARVEMAEGRWQDALESFRTGFQLAQDVAQPPTLINALVGVAIAQIMLADLQLMTQDPDAPNLYWALTTLPKPLIDMRPSLEQEMSFTMRMLPALKDVETVDRTDEEWNRQLMQSISVLEDAAGDGGAIDNNLMLTGFAAIAYPAAKRELINAGYSKDDVEAMPIGKVILLQTSRATRYAVDETFKWSYLPFAEAQPGLKQTEQRLIDEGYLGGAPTKVGTLPVASLLLPAVSNAIYAPLKLERNVAMARALEAVRMHAARYHGKWPDSLQDIREVPVPRDPLNNQPFGYRVEDGVVILEMPPREGFTPSSDGLRILLKR